MTYDNDGSDQQPEQKWSRTGPCIGNMQKKLIKTETKYGHSTIIFTLRLSHNTLLGNVISNRLRYFRFRKTKNNTVYFVIVF